MTDQILEALQIGLDSAKSEAAYFHDAMAGYFPEDHAMHDDNVRKIEEAIVLWKLKTEVKSDYIKFCIYDALTSTVEIKPDSCRHRKAHSIRESDTTAWPLHFNHGAGLVCKSQGRRSLAEVSDV